MLIVGRNRVGEAEFTYGLTTLLCMRGTIGFRDLRIA